jgi:threonine-phosphate decarboxylase
MDFSNELNPLGVPESVTRLFLNLGPNLSFPPSPKNGDLCKEIARHYPVWEENVIVDRSFPALLALVVQAMQPKRVLIFEPCSPEYRRILNLLGVEILSQPLLEPEGFAYRLPKILNGLHGADMLILGNPNDPTGSALSKEEFQELIDDAKRRNIFVVIDESFSLAPPLLSACQQVKDNSYFFVCRSIANYYSLPGTGASYGVGARKLVERLRLRQDPAVLSRVAELINIEAVRDTVYQEETQAWFAEEFPRLLGEFQRLEGIKIYAGEALFVLAKLKGRLQAQELIQYLAERKIFIRKCDVYAGLDSSYFRVSLGKPAENRELAAAMSDWMKTHHADLRIALKPDSKMPPGFEAPGGLT